MPLVFYCDAEKFEHLLEDCIAALPEERKEKTEKLLKKKERLLSAMAGLMTVKCFGSSAFKNMKYNEHGKPYFEHGPFFSISHSGRYAVLAVSDYEIGVDIEDREKVDLAVAKRCFTEDEQNFIGLDAKKFMRIWTAKEAVLKLTGSGFSYSPKNFSVLPLDSEHEIMGIKMRFFCTEINKVPLTAAFCQNNDDFEIKEFFPKDLLI